MESDWTPVLISHLHHQWGNPGQLSIFISDWLTICSVSGGSPYEIGYDLMCLLWHCKLCHLAYVSASMCVLRIWVKGLSASRLRPYEHTASRQTTSKLNATLSNLSNRHWCFNEENTYCFRYTSVDLCSDYPAKEVCNWDSIEFHSEDVHSLLAL